MAHRRQSHRKRKEIEPGALSDGSERGMCGRKRQTIFSSEQFEDIAGAVLAGKHGAVQIATKLPESTSWRKLCGANNIPVHYAPNLMVHTQNKVTAAVETAMGGRLEEVEKELALAKHALVNMQRKLSRREKEAAIALATEQAASEEAIFIKNAEIKELKAWRLATDFALMEEEELRNMEAAAAAGAGLSQQVSPMAYSCTTCSLFPSPLQCRWLTPPMPDGLPIPQEELKLVLFFERGKFTARARIIGYNLLRRGVAAKELGGCMEALAPLFGVKLVSDNPAHSAVPSDKTSRKFQVSSMACSCTASQLHHLTAALPKLHCLTPPMPDGLQLHTRNG